MFIKFIKTVGRWFYKFIKGALAIGSVAGVMHTVANGPDATSRHVKGCADKIGAALGSMMKAVAPKKGGVIDRFTQKVSRHGGMGFAAYITVLTLVCSVKYLFFPVFPLTKWVKSVIIPPQTDGDEVGMSNFNGDVTTESTCPSRAG